MTKDIGSSEKPDMLKMLKAAIEQATGKEISLTEKRCIGYEGAFLNGESFIIQDAFYYVGKEIVLAFLFSQQCYRATFDGAKLLKVSLLEK